MNHVSYLWRSSYKMEDRAQSIFYVEVRKAVSWPRYTKHDCGNANIWENEVQAAVGNGATLYQNSDTVVLLDRAC